jgi:hypothetical protein
VALDLITELEAVLRSFEHEGVEYALCGGLAVAIYGHPRATMDIDLLIRPEDIDAALAAARRVGFDIPARKMTWSIATPNAREMQRISKLDPTTNALVSLDLILAGPPLANVWSTRQRAAWRSLTLSIVSRDGLATMKRLAGRPQDLADIAALEGSSEEE